MRTVLTRGHAGPGAATGDPAGAPRLVDLAPGAAASVLAIAPGTPPSVARRLRDLGLRPGAEVGCVRRAPLGGPAVYRVAEADLCLRRATAEAVLLAGAPA